MTKIINLLPKTEQKELRLEFYAGILKQFWTAVGISMVLLFVLSFGSEFYLSQSAASVDKDIVRLRSELSTAANQKLDDEVKALNSQIKTIKNLRTQHYYWSNSLVELSRIIPSDLAVDFMIMDRATGKVEISGKAGSRVSVIQFWANVKRSNLFKDINFPLTNLEKDRNGAFVYTFYINTEAIKHE